MPAESDSDFGQEHKPEASGSASGSALTAIMDLLRDFKREFIIAAIVLAILLLLICCCCVFICVRRRKARRDKGRSSDADAEAGGERERLIPAEEDEEAPAEAAEKIFSPPESIESKPEPEERPPSPVPAAAKDEPEPAPAPVPASELPVARIILPYISTGTGKSLADLRDKLETDLQEMFGEFERTDDEELEGEDEGPVIEENSNWIFDIPMADTPENRESLLGLATWLRDAAELHTLYLRYPDGEEVNLDEDE